MHQKQRRVFVAVPVQVAEHRFAKDERLDFEREASLFFGRELTSFA
jgi:hypothetical protein